MTEQVRSDHILHAISQLHLRRGDQFFAEVKNGSTWAPKGDLLRIDGLAMAKSWTKPMFTGYEVKISRSDFLRDAKWHLYAEYCHRLVMVCPKGMIKATEVPDFAGLLWYNPDTKLLTTKKRPVTREIEVNQDMLYYIIMSKLEPDKHPFFSDRREMLEAWVEDKKSTRWLSREVRSNLIDKLAEYETESRRLQHYQDSYEGAQTRLHELMDLVSKYGIRTTYWPALIGQLEKTLAAKGIPPNVTHRVQELLACAGRLAEVVKDVDGQAARRMG